MKKWMPKELVVTFRTDVTTRELLDELASLMGKKHLSDVIRLAIWFLVVVHDPKLTVRKAFRPEALDVVVKGGDIPLGEALKPITELFKEIGVNPT